MKRLPPLQIIAYSIGNLAGGLYNAFTNFTLPLFLSIYTHNAILIGWLSSTRSFEQAVVQPIVGARSDRTWTRFGRRAPYFLIAMPLTALVLIFTAQLPSDPSYFPLVALCVIVFSFTFNIGIDPYIALLADVTPSEQRGIVNGIAQVFEFVGRVAILIGAAVLFSTHADWIFYLVAGGLVLGFLVVALGVRESRDRMQPESKLATVPPRDAEAAARTWRELPVIRAVLAFPPYLLGLWTQQREASKLLGVKFLYRFGLNAALPFITLFMVTEIGLNGWSGLLNAVPALGSISVLQNMDAGGVSQLTGAVLLLSTAIFAIPIGLLGDRIGKKRVFGAGLFVLGIFALLVAFATTVPQLLLYFVFLGFGASTLAVLYFPYLADLVTPNRVGEFQGLSAAVETGGVFVSILVAGALINADVFGLGYRTTFILTGVFMLLALAALWFVPARLGDPDAAGSTAPEPSRV